MADEFAALDAPAAGDEFSALDVAPKKDEFAALDAAPPEWASLKNQLGSTFVNPVIKAAKGSASLLYGVGGLLPGAAGEWFHKQGQGAQQALDQMKFAEPGADLPIVGHVEPSDIFSMAPYMAGTGITGMGLKAAEMAPEAAHALSVLGPMIAPALSDVKNAATPEERSQAIENANKTLLMGLAIHGATGLLGRAGEATKPFAPPQDSIVDVSPDGLKTVLKPNGDQVQELPQAHPDWHTAAEHVISKSLDVNPDNLQSALKRLEERYPTDKPVKLETGKVDISETIDGDKGITISLSPRDETLFNLTHEYLMHVNNKGGIPELSDIPHDNQALAQWITSNGLPGDKPPTVEGERPVVGVQHVAADDEPLVNIAKVNPDAAEGVKRNYSLSGATKEATIERGVQLRQALGDEAYQNWMNARTAGEIARASQMRFAAEAQRLGYDAKALNRFSAVKNQMALDRMVDRWNEWGDTIGDMEQDDFKTKKVQAQWKSRLDKAVQYGVADDSVSQAFDKAIAEGKLPVAQDLLKQTFSAAADKVGRIDPVNFDMGEYRKGQEYSDLRDLYGNTLEKLLAKYHEQGGGMASDVRDADGQFFPLTPKVAPPPPVTSNARFNLTSMARNNMRTGLAGQYDTSMEALGDALPGVVRSGARAALMDKLLDSGVIQKIGRDEPIPQYITVNGKKMQPKIVSDFTGQRYATPYFLAQDAGDLISNKQFDPFKDYMRGGLNRFNRMALVGYGDAVYHSYNQVNNYVNAIADDAGALGHAIDAVPFGRALRVMAKAYNIDINDPKYWEDVQRVSEAGALPSRYGLETYSDQFKKAFGAKQAPRYNLGAFIYGPAGIDARLRVSALRALDEIEPKASPVTQHAYLVKLGNYAAGLEGRLGAALKGSGLSPFYTAGATRIRNAFDLMSYPARALQDLGAGMQDTQNPFAAPTPKATQTGEGTLFLKNLIWNYLGTWAIGNRLINGKFPWDDDRSRFGEIRVPGKEGRDWYISPLGTSVQQEAAKLSGARGVYNALKRGGNDLQMMDGALVDSINAIHQPLHGPATNTIISLPAGDRPYVRSFVGDKGKPGAQLLNFERLPEDVPDYFKQRGKTLVSSINPTVNVGIGTASGKSKFGEPDDPTYLKVADALAESILGSFVRRMDPDAQRRYLTRQQQQMNTGLAIQRARE